MSQRDPSPAPAQTRPAPESWTPLRWTKLEELIEPPAPVKSPFKALQSARDLALEAGEEPPGAFKALWGQRAPEPVEPEPAPERSIDFERELQLAREAAWQEGYAQANAEALAREQAQDRVAEALCQSLDKLAAARAELVSADLAERVAELGLELAQTAFGPPTRPSQEHWKMLTNALFEQLMAVAGPAQIFAHPGDLPSLQNALSTLAERWPEELSVLPDEQIEPGSLRMTRGPFGADASFSSRLNSISLAMKESDEPA